MASLKGLTRPRRNGREIEGSTYLARLVVPSDVREIAASLPEDDPRRATFLGEDNKPRHELLQTTGSNDPRVAVPIGEAIRANWKREIAALRTLGNPERVAEAQDRIEAWRRDSMARAQQAAHAEAALLEYAARGAPSPVPGVEYGGAEWARLYFEARPDADRSTGLPFVTGLLLDRLRKAEADPTRWKDVPGYDGALDAALDRELEFKVRNAVRPAFTHAWRQVIEAEEVERRHAASILQMVQSYSEGTPALPPRPGAYQLREGDRTVGEMMDAYLAAQKAKKGKRGDIAHKETAHIFKALREMLGPDKPVRAVTRSDILEIQALLRRVPKDATKLYGKQITFAEAAERGEKEGRKLLSHNTVRSYVSAASSMWNWALAQGEEWADRNPVRGLAGERRDSVKRGGFTDDQLVMLFASLASYKVTDAARFWIPALALNGARLGELCQLRTSDVLEVQGVTYLDFSEFDTDTGERVEDKSLKTAGSERIAPIHPLAIKAGFKEFVARRRASGETRLFPELKYSELKGWGHEMSRWFGRHLDSIDLKSRKLTFHSFRHGFRQRGRDAGLSSEILDAVGGWKGKTTGERYGGNEIVALNRHLVKVSYGALKL